eukprot:1839334-Amphidinium_carterae.1
MERQVPKHYGRPGNVDAEAPRSHLLGAYVVRGVGLSRATDTVRGRRVLELVHQLAALRPGCDTREARFSYLSVNLNQNPVLVAHTDRSNLGWSWNLALGSYTG